MGDPLTFLPPSWPNFMGFEISQVFSSAKCHPQLDCWIMSLKLLDHGLMYNSVMVMDILYRSSMKGNIRQEPKYIVFLSLLMLLFRFCQLRKSADIIVETSERGTMICVQTQCGNPKCSKRDSVWQSQPLLEDTKTAAGNILLSFAILLAGASASKVLRVFSHVGVACQ